jgi:hypothetical protein
MPDFFYKNPDLQSRQWRACYFASLREFGPHEFGQDEARQIAQIFADKMEQEDKNDTTLEKTA